MKLINIKNVIFAGLALVMVFAPLARGAVWLWSISFIEAIVFTLVFVWLWHMNNTNNWQMRTTKLDGPIWGFVLLAIISSVFSIYPYASVLEIFRVLTYVSVYYLVVNFLDWRRQLRFFELIISMGVLLSFIGIGQYFFNFNHGWWTNNMAATYANHAHFAGFIEMAMALNLGLLFGLTQDDVISSFQLLFKRIVLSGSLLVMIIAFILTQSRGGWISFTIALGVFIAILLQSKIISKWKFAIFLLSLLLFIGFLGLGEDRIAYRLHTIEMGEESRLLKGRIEIWESSVGMIKDNPLTGTGIGTFVWAFPRYRPEGLRARYHYAHNDYIQMTSEMGGLVIPLFLWGIFALLTSGLSRQANDFLLRHMMRVACCMGLLSLIIHGFVDFNFHVPANMLLFVCLAAMVMRTPEFKRDKIERRG